MALIAVCLIATGLAAWGITHAVNPDALQASFASMSPGWALLAAAAFALSTFASALVWRLGLAAGGLDSIGPGHAVSVHWMARGAGELLPAQLGEGVRMAAIRRHPATESGGCARIAGSMGAYKVIDGIGNFAVVALVALVIPLPGPAAHLRWLAAAALVGTVLAAVIAARVGTARLIAALPERLARPFATVADGAALLGRHRQAAGAFGLQMVAAGGRIISFAALLHAFGLPASAALLVFAVLVMSALIPISPGGIGVREAALVPALVAAYGFGADTALAFSLGIQATVLSVSLVGGLIALAYHELSLTRTRRAVRAAVVAA